MLRKLFPISPGSRPLGIPSPVRSTDPTSSPGLSSFELGGREKGKALGTRLGTDQDKQMKGSYALHV